LQHAPPSPPEISRHHKLARHHTLMRFYPWQAVPHAGSHAGACAGRTRRHRQRSPRLGLARAGAAARGGSLTRRHRKDGGGATSRGGPSFSRWWSSGCAPPGASRAPSCCGARAPRAWRSTAARGRRALRWRPAVGEEHGGSEQRQRSRLHAQPPLAEPCAPTQRAQAWALVAHGGLMPGLAARAAAAVL